MRRNYIFVCLTALSLAFTGCGGDKKVEERVAQIQTNAHTEQNSSSTPEAPKATDAKSAQPFNGKQLFETRCAACHGEKGEGKASYPKLAGNSKVMVEVCANCHPVYTGQAGIVLDTSNRIDRWNKQASTIDQSRVELKKRKKLVRNDKVSAVNAGPSLTLKDMLKQAGR